MNLLYVHGSAIGYGQLGVRLAEQLHRMGVVVYDDLPVPDGGSPDGSKPELNRRTGVSNVICWVSTPSHARWWYEGQRPLLVTMWEATKLPEQFREQLHHFETLIVPSQQNLELFGRFHPNVKLVPLGIDPERWAFQRRQTPDNEFRFLLGGSGVRKGSDLARRAFRAAFPPDVQRSGPNPVLVLKSPKGEDAFLGPNVQVVAGRLSDQEEVDLYASAHCYLQPSRGEGFGLQPLQAIAQGIPTILTGAHGHAGFAHLGIPLDSTMSKSAYFIYGDAGDWWEPDFDQLVDAMRWVYNNYDGATASAQESSVVARRDWTWAKTAEKFVEAIGPEHLGPYTGNGKVFTPAARHFLVITNRDWIADIGGSSFEFKKGQRYWEPADVKRILFEGEILDPACLDLLRDSPEDLGLAPAQYEQIEQYTAAHAFCSQCGQKLGSGLTKADEIYEQLELAVT